jgi:hypothetical protein
MHHDAGVECVLCCADRSQGCSSGGSPSWVLGHQGPGSCFLAWLPAHQSWGGVAAGGHPFRVAWWGPVWRAYGQSKTARCGQHQQPLLWLAVMTVNVVWGKGAGLQACPQVRCCCSCGCVSVICCWQLRLLAVSRCLPGRASTHFTTLQCSCGAAQGVAQASKLACGRPSAVLLCAPPLAPGSISISKHSAPILSKVPPVPVYFQSIP